MCCFQYAQLMTHSWGNIWQTKCQRVRRVRATRALDHSLGQQLCCDVCAGSIQSTQKLNACTASQSSTNVTSHNQLYEHIFIAQWILSTHEIQHLKKRQFPFTNHIAYNTRNGNYVGTLQGIDLALLHADLTFSTIILALIGSFLTTIQLLIRPTSDHALIYYWRQKQENKYFEEQRQQSSIRAVSCWPMSVLCNQSTHDKNDTWREQIHWFQSTINIISRYANKSPYPP